MARPSPDTSNWTLRGHVSCWLHNQQMIEDNHGTWHCPGCEPPTLYDWEQETP